MLPSVPMEIDQIAIIHSGSYLTGKGSVHREANAMISILDSSILFSNSRQKKKKKKRKDPKCYYLNLHNSEKKRKKKKKQNHDH